MVKRAVRVRSRDASKLRQGAAQGRRHCSSMELSLIELSLFLFLDSYRQHIAGGAVENAVSRRTEDQCQAVAAMAADNDQVHIIFPCEAVHFVGGLANDHMELTSKPANSAFLNDSRRASA